MRKKQEVHTALPMQPFCVCCVAVAKERLKFLSTQRVGTRPLELMPSSSGRVDCLTSFELPLRLPHRSMKLMKLRRWEDVC